MEGTWPTVRRSSYRVRAALEYLRKLLDTVGPGQRLPTIVACAKETGVSQETMSKAVRLLSGQGLVRVSQGAGIVSAGGATKAGGRSPAPFPAIDSLSSWERVRKHVTADILAGVYEPGAYLPSLKELCGRYHTGYATMNRALRSLSFLDRPGRRYRLGRGQHAPADSSIGVVAESDSIATLMTHSPATPQLWHGLEQECIQRGTSLRILDIRSYLGSASKRTHGAAPRFIGYILLTQALSRRHIADAIRKTGLPLALYDESGRHLAQPAPDKRRRVRVFAHTDNRQSGRIVGRHLIGAGHRRVVCFSRAPGVRWSDERVEGICDVFSDVGLSDGVRVCPVEQSDTWEASLGSTPTESAPADFVRQADMMMGCLSESQRPALSAGVRRHLLSGLLGWEEQQNLQPAFEEFISNDTVTAWVGAHDRLLLHALDFFDRSGLGPDRRPLLIGFDNTVAALARGLSSFDYAVGAVATAMVRSILGDQVFASVASDQPVVVPGRLIIR